MKALRLPLIRQFEITQLFKCASTSSLMKHDLITLGLEN
jgi:hypothetical protein